MTNDNFQHTLLGTVEWEGIGLHTGALCRVRVLPWDQGGLWFQQKDHRFPALLESVVSTQRCTTLGDGKAQVSTVEHLLSALWGAGITSALIQVEGPEIPILDGSALPFWESLRKAGSRSLLIPMPQGRLTHPVIYYQEPALLVALPPLEGQSAPLEITFSHQVDHPLLRDQAFRIAISRENFGQELAPARTYGFIEEVQSLRDQGLIQGGSLDNALILTLDRYLSPLRLPEEPARHKILDLLGDLSLLGLEWRGQIIAIGGGHRHNIAFARLLQPHLKEGLCDDGNSKTF